MWKLDLRGVSYLPKTGLRLQIYSLHPKSTNYILGNHSISFSRSGLLAIAFLTEEVGGKNPDLVGSRKLHVISLEAATGKIVANRIWPAQNADNGSVDVGATKQGNFVVLRRDATGQAVCLYSPELREIGRIGLPPDPAISRSGWSIFVPPSGESIFVEHYLNDAYSLRMLGSETLHEIRVWDNSEGIESVSGKYLLRWQPETSKSRQWYSRTLDEPWRALANMGETGEFINEDTLVTTSDNSVSLIRADGAVLFTAGIPKNRLAATAWASPDERFVAVATTTTRGLAVALAFDMSSGRSPRRILVYDTKTRTVVDSLRFTWGFSGAFSPDSSRFALLSGEILQMFQLPTSASPEFK
jgi:hypothetical protein